MCDCEDNDLTELREAKRQRDLRIMQGDTFKDNFQDSFTDLRKAIFRRDAEETRELIDYIESSACSLVEQFDDAYQRAANIEEQLEQTKVKP